MIMILEFIDLVALNILLQPFLLILSDEFRSGKAIDSIMLLLVFLMSGLLLASPFINLFLGVSQ